MKRKIFSILFALVLVLSFSLMPAVPAMANDVPSSTIVFQASTAYPLTYNGDGTYTGVIPCVVGGGYDIYAKEGASAWFGDDPGSGSVWTSQVITAHDAWPIWTPDTPDWYQYSLYLYEDGGVQKWAIRNHAGATVITPWYETSTTAGTNGETNPGLWPRIPNGVPMSGTMDWAVMYAMETDTGAYLTGTPEIPGGAASQGGGAGYWDMDWSWGSEAVPLQYPGFDVAVTGGGATTYMVTMTPAAAGTTHLTVELPDIVAISVNPTSIDFGSLIPGQASAEYDVAVVNVGTHQCKVDADVSGSGGDLFYDNLYLKNLSGGYSLRDWGDIITGLNMNQSQTLRTYLQVPSDYTPVGVETAQLTFTVTGTP